MEAVTKAKFEAWKMAEHLLVHAQYLCGQLDDWYEGAGGIPPKAVYEEMKQVEESLVKVRQLVKDAIQNQRHRDSGQVQEGTGGHQGAGLRSGTDGTDYASNDPRHKRGR